MIDLALDILATHRLARFVTADDLPAGLRDAIIRHAYGPARAERVRVAMVNDGREPSIPGAWARWVVEREPDPPKLGTLVSCRWCCSAWIAFGVVLARRVVPRWWRPVAYALALSSASTLLADLEH